MFKNGIEILVTKRIIKAGKINSYLLHKTFHKSTQMSNWNESVGPSPNKLFRGNNRNRFLECQQMMQPVPLMNITMPPPPPPPIVVNCGELREYHHGALVELYGRVAKQRMGRFIELKDSHGVTQLVAPDSEPSMGRRFSNMPIDSMITIYGYVHRRPPISRNSSISTGNIEVHVESIKMERLADRRTQYREQKRFYSTSSGKPQRGITTREYKKAKSDNIIKYFENREVTCGELRLTDVGRNVTVVGWLDPKKRGKFMEIQDGYGHIQIVNEQLNPESSYKILSATDDDIILVEGKVVARPISNQFSKSETGDIEIFIENFKVLDANEIYDGPIISNNITEDITKDVSQTENVSFIKKSSNDGIDVNKYTYRTYNCGELSEKNIGEEVILCGWLEYQRMRKFLTIRDAYGSTQIIFPQDLYNLSEIESAPFETILKCTGKIMARPPGLENKNLATGGIELIAKSIEILNLCRKNLPVELRKFNRAKEGLRLEYRYLDMRFPDMQNNLRTRSNILMNFREYLIKHVGFVEIETPTLFRRTPGGAQEYVVPTRKPGYFYSLVQSPQQFKQMLMAGAVDRYFQIARCYRDEATRSDRQPEFTQLDIELSFTDRNSIMELIEDLLVYSLPEKTEKITKPFLKMTYDDAMNRYGTDKPDTRFDMLLQNITQSLINVENAEDFAAYAIIVEDLNDPIPNQLKKQIDKIRRQNNTKVLTGRVVCKNEVFECNELQSYFDIDKISKLIKLKDQNNIIITYGKKLPTLVAMGRIRLAVMEYLEDHNLVIPRNNNEYKFLWVIDFPMFTKADNSEEYESTHHPFTAPHPDDMEILLEKKNLDKIRSLAYDLVLNGSEVGGGSIRIHDASLQRSILRDYLNIGYEHLHHLLDALGSGCPPHGGIALGIDRFMSIICDTQSIRDVIAFPKSIDGKDPLSKSPYEITEEEKQIYNIEVVKKVSTTTKTESLPPKSQVLETT